MAAKDIRLRCLFVWWSVREWMQSRRRVAVGSRLCPATGTATEDILAELEELTAHSAFLPLIRSLSPLRQLVFLRRYHYLDTIEEIAQRYGIHPSYVMFLAWKNRMALNSWLGRRSAHS